METFLTFVIIGLSAGSIYGLAGAGLVLTYKTSGIMNFSHGAVGAAAAYVFFYLYAERNVSLVLALALSIFVFGTVVGIIFEPLARRLADSPPSMQIVATVGIILLVRGLAHAWMGNQYTAFPDFMPSGSLRLVGVNVGFDRMIIILVGLMATGLLHIFLRTSRLGISMRAVVDNPLLTGLLGIDPTRVRRWAWIIGTNFACLSGILIAPSLSLDALLLIMVVLQAFGAAAIGYFSSLRRTYLGGLVIGILAALATKYLPARELLTGIAGSVPFIVLFIVLAVTKPSRLWVRSQTSARVESPWLAPVRIRIIGAVLGAAGLAAVPYIVGARLPLWIFGVAYMGLFLSLGFLMKTAGLVSLSHIVFVAVGAAAMSHLTEGLGLPWFLALVLAGLITAPVGAIIAIPAVRVSGVYLALATLGFGIMVQHVFYNKSIMFGSFGRVAIVPRPGFATRDIPYYYVVLTITILLAVLVAVLETSRLGRILRANSDSSVALRSLGGSPTTVLVIVFGTSAFIAGLSGALLAAGIGAVNGDAFPASTSLTLVAILVILPGRLPWLAVIAGLGHGTIPTYLDVIPFEWFLVLFGVVATSHAVGGTWTTPIWLRQALERFDHRLERQGYEEGNPSSELGTLSDEQTTRSSSEL